MVCLELFPKSRGLRSEILPFTHLPGFPAQFAQNGTRLTSPLGGMRKEWQVSELMSGFRTFRCPSSQGFENVGEGGARAQDEAKAPVFGKLRSRWERCLLSASHSTSHRAGPLGLQGLICKRGGNKL